LSRSDFITPNKKQEVYFSDIPMNLDMNPLSNGLAVVTNEQAIKQSLKCLILTNLGERWYDSTIGSDVKRQLFEQNVDIGINTIKFAITNTIEFNEPRVKIVSLDVSPSSDENYLNVSLTFSLVNNPAPITLSLILKRLR